MKKKRECWIGEDGYCHAPLAKGKGEVITDAEFIEEVSKYNWRLSHYGYATTTINNREVSFHRFIFILKYGLIKNGLELDHIDRNKRNNMIYNLREATPQQNLMNRNKIKGNFKGVSLDNKTKRYRAQIKIDCKTKSLGYYENEKDAAYHYDVAAYYYFKEFAVLNFPQNIEKYKNEELAKLSFKKTKASSKFVGVSFNKADNKFVAYCLVNKKLKYLGLFEEEVTAAKVRDLYIIKNNLRAKLNFPLETYQEELNQEPKNMVVFKAN